VDELAVMLRWAFEHIQRPGRTRDGTTGDGAGGSVYLRLSTRSISQPQRQLSTADTAALLDGAYWIRRPGPNAEVVVAYAEAVAPEAVEAVGMIAEDRRDVGLLAVTSADRLYSGWTEAREQGGDRARMSHVEQILAAIPRHCGLVTMLDGHPATLGWLGSVHGHRTRTLGVSTFGQTGTIADLYRAAGIDARAIAGAAEAVVPGRPARHLRAV